MDYWEEVVNRKVWEPLWISLWQFAHRRTHFLHSSVIFS